MATLALKLVCCFVTMVLFPLGLVAVLDQK
jgi:hypothetical protein